MTPCVPSLRTCVLKVKTLLGRYANHAYLDQNGVLCFRIGGVTAVGPKGFGGRVSHETLDVHGVRGPVVNPGIVVRRDQHGLVETGLGILRKRRAKVDVAKVELQAVFHGDGSHLSRWKGKVFIEHASLQSAGL